MKISDMKLPVFPSALSAGKLSEFLCSVCVCISISSSGKIICFQIFYVYFINLILN